ncbi:MAG: hypothetical protein QE271_12195 [Bacteriovoracaceae bacterium]|nr:hypothetical protein [Bacteriovoracaceae bacterium]
MSYIKRPVLIKWVCIARESSIHFLAEVDRELTQLNIFRKSKKIRPFTTPWDHLHFFSEKKYALMMIGLNSIGRIIYKRFFFSHSNGLFQGQIPRTSNLGEQIHSLRVYECGVKIGSYYYLGTFLPQILTHPYKIIISDFDKTLLETKYSTTKEMWKSVTSPMNKYPSLQKGLDLLQLFVIKGHQAFVVSASPYFYERPIRQWLYQHHIYTASIFLKDYRIILSPLNFLLGTKDISTHGFYKLSQIITILELTGVPDELVLMGDNFESDPLIYKLVYALLMRNLESHHALRFFEKIPAFKMNVTQKTFFLSKFQSILSRHQKPKHIKILIRTVPFPRHSQNKIKNISEEQDKIMKQLTEEINDFVPENVLEFYSDSPSK